MSAFAWLNDLMMWLGRFFPRLTLVKLTEAGVLFGRGGACRAIGPGLCFYWPLVAELKVTPTTRRSLEICAQLVGDETISIAVFFRVRDVLTALTNLTDLTGNLDDYAQSALSASCASVAHPTNDALQSLVKTRLQDRTAAFGIEILDIGIIHRGAPLPIKMIGDWATHEDPNRS